MSRVFVSEATRAVIYVFADDHCPPDNGCGAFGSPIPVTPQVLQRYLAENSCPSVAIISRQATLISTLLADPILRLAEAKIRE